MTGVPFTITGDLGPVVATSVHAGHELRPDVADLLALDDDTRRREEDPATDALTDVGSLRVVVHRSRFEVDLNRSRDGAVYADPSEAWGLDLWRRPPSYDLIARSLEVYDAFYGELATYLDELASQTRFVVLDLHSYNHRRDGPDEAPAPVEANPEVDVCTGSLDRARWGHIVDRFIAELREQHAQGHRLDVRENVRFRGGHFCRWVNDRYAGTGCAWAIEFKKVFMDEGSGEVDLDHLHELRDALAATVPGIADELGGHR